MNRWGYRVVKYDEYDEVAREGKVVYVLKRVYYDEDGKPVSCGMANIAVADSVKELLEVCQSYVNAVGNVNNGVMRVLDESEVE